MFGQKFSVTKFSANAEKPVIALAFNFFDTLEGTAWGGKNLDTDNMTFSFVENLKVVGSGVVGVQLVITFSETMTGTATTTLNIICAFSFADELQGTAKATKTIYFALPFSDKLTSKSSGAKNASISFSYVDKLLTFATLGVNSFAHANMSDIMSGIAGGVTLTEEICIVDVEIPAGATLIIDSQRYTVQLNGVSVIYLHSGEFIKIDPTIKAILLNTGDGGVLASSVAYTARYL